MFDLKNATNQQLDIKSILDKVTEYDIWKMYCGNFVEIDKSFCSELYNDRNPGCRIYYNKTNSLVYKDFGTGDNYNCFDYIQAKYGCNFPECLNIIYNDFKLGSVKYDIIPQLVLNNAPELLKNDNKAHIEICSQPFTLTDYLYWDKYEIPLHKLEEYNVFSCKHVYLHTKKGKIVVFDYKNDNPIYAYRFCNNGEYSYKIYFPLTKDKKYKWLFSGGSSKDIEGYDQLPWLGKDLILTKSLKDCICYNLLGIPAISLQGETNILGEELVIKLKQRFDNIIINYDNDPEGIKNTNKLHNKYNFNYFYVDKTKDLSDYIEQYGILKAKKMINKKIKQLHE